MNQPVQLKVDGMDCANCAANITTFLKKKGLADVYVNFSTGEVRFSENPNNLSLEEIRQGIHKLGYTVVGEDKKPFWTLEKADPVSHFYLAAFAGAFPDDGRPAFSGKPLASICYLPAGLCHWFYPFRQHKPRCLAERKHPHGCTDLSRKYGSFHLQPDRNLAWKSGLYFLRNQRHDHYPGTSGQLV